MAFVQKNLSVLAYANGFTLWHYTTPDKAAEVNATGYFNFAADMLRPGDMILCNSSTGEATVNGIFAIASNQSGVVDVASMTPPVSVPEPMVQQAA